MITKSYTGRYLVESPTGEGPSFNDEVVPSKIEPDEKKFYLDRKVQSEEGRQDIVAQIIVKVKEFLLSQPNKIYVGDYKAFRDELVPIILSVVPSIGSSNATYCSRRIQVYLLSRGILIDERNGLKLEKPLKTADAVKVLTPEIKNKIDDSSESESDYDSEPEVLTKKEEDKPSFETNTKYEKCAECDESALSEEEKDALDLIKDNDTGSIIIQKLQNKRSLKNKSLTEIHSLISRLINAGALIPAGGFNFNAEVPDLPAYKEHLRQNKTFGDSYIMKFHDDELMMEKYINNLQTVNEAGGIIDKVVSKMPTFFGNRAAQATGNIHAAKQQEQLYKAFLQNIGQSGYSQKNVPGNYLVGWMAQNFNQAISQLPEAQSINSDKPVQNPQLQFNKIIQAYNRFQIVGNQTAAPQQAQPAPQLQPTPTGNIQPPKKPGSKPTTPSQNFGLPQSEYQLLMAALSNVKNNDPRAKTRIINNFLKKNGFQRPPPPQTP